MLSVKNAIFKVFLVLLVFTSFTIVSAIYVPTNRDTKEPPEEVTYDITEPTEMQLLHENDNFKYYYRESRDTFAIYDKRNNYTWKTGTDLEFAKDIDDECDDILDLYEEQFVGLDPLTFGNFVLTTTTTSSFEGNNGRLRVTLEELDENSAEDAVTVTLDGLVLEQNKEYQLSLSLRANDAINMNLSLGTYHSETINVPTEETTFTINIDMTDATDNDVLLTLALGNIDDVFANTLFYLDNLKLEEYDQALNDGEGGVVDATNQITRGDFELLEAEYTVVDDDLLAACRPKEIKLNTTYTGFANSLVTVEYYDISNNIKRASSAAHKNVTSELMTVNGDDTHYRLEIDFWSIDIEVMVHIYLEETGIRYEVRDEEITGEGTEVLAAIIISPFLGASGGAYEEFSLEELDYADEDIFKYRIPGYTFVPDGSGALIRFADNDVKLDPYKGQVYGIDPGQKELHYSSSDNYVEFKQPSMPVFGMAHGNQQAAFVAYATQGDDHMEIISMPDENLTYYNFTYPRFEYNKQYLQVYNKMGWGYLTLYEDRNHFDIEMKYDFLSGDGSTGHSADYVGMARAYREYLLEEGLLTEFNPDYDDIPIRLDFFMSDVEKSIIGYNNMVTTTSTGVDEILSQIRELGIENVNSGLLGWNDGGVTLGDPRDTDFTREIGRKRDFKSLIAKYNDLGIDISFINDYYNINEEQMTLRRNAAQHTSTWYANIQTWNYPVDMFYYARPTKSVDWMEEQTDTFRSMGVNSYTIYGISNNLITDYTNDASRTDAKMLIKEAFANLGDEQLINAYQPNSYLWPYVDRYLGTPVYGTQYLIESDTVPFLQLVLQGTMEMYGPYSNFSFYTDEDVLRMVDYNIYPNFILTKEPAHLLTDTNSRNYYSSEYTLYESLIDSIYSRVNEALREVIGAEWQNRTVVENGVIVNTYSNGVEIVINYKDEAVTYNGEVIDPLSYGVIGD